MVTHVFDNSNLSQEIFRIDTWGSCNMLFGTWSQAYAYDPSDYMETRLYEIRYSELVMVMGYGLPSEIIFTILVLLS